MKRAWTLGVLVVAGLAGGLGYAAWARADAKPAPAPAQISKFVLVHDRVTNTAMAVEKAELQMIGGKPFLVGTGAKGGRVRTPAAGRPVWVNLEDACTVIHFDNLDDLEKAVEAAGPPGPPRDF